MSTSISRRKASNALQRGLHTSTRLANASSFDAPALWPKYNQPAASSSSSPSNHQQRLDDAEYRYVPKRFAPDVQHPSYHEDQIMDFRDRGAKLPPALAKSRIDKLKKARELGIYVNRFNKPPRREPQPLPDVPVRLAKVEEKAARGKVDYQMGKVGVTNDRLAYYEDKAAQREDMTSQTADWSGADEETDIPGLDPGRIVEIRRSGQMSTGMILASIVISGKPRYLLLRSTGEIWPISSQDVQFVMPASLITPQTAEACWTPELLDLWAKGEEATGSEIAGAMEPMLEARRSAVMVLRKINRETERMCGKMMGGNVAKGRLGNIEGIWEHFAKSDPTQRTSVTSAQVAEFILNAPDAESPLTIKPNTLPAYAAHCIMMSRSDLFLADAGEMWSSGRFLVRSREERERMSEVESFIDARTDEDKAAFQAFMKKARKAIAVSRDLKKDTNNIETYTPADHDLPAWTDKEKAMIQLLLLRLFETRSTQTATVESLSVSVIKALGTYNDTQASHEILPRLLNELGVMPAWEHMQGSGMLETKAREKAAAGLSTISGRQQGDLLHGNELDELREDFTNHKIFVIDDASASELDDGVALERIPGSEDVWMHVHVADPTRFIPLNHPASLEASFQGSSIYLPEGNIPLLPLDVIMKELSLGANVSRDEGRQGTMTFSAKMSPSGEMLDANVRMGWIKKPRVVTYNAVNEALRIDTARATRPFGRPIVDRAERTYTPVASEDIEDLKLIQRFATSIRSKRLSQAGLEFNRPQSSVSVLTSIPTGITNYFDLQQTPDRPAFYPGSPLIDWTVQNTSFSKAGLPSQSIVAELMIMAGRVAAQWCGERGIPVAYRSSAVPSLAALAGREAMTLDQMRSMRDPVTLMSDPFDVEKASMLIAPAVASLTPAPHWTMGFMDTKGYVRTTSPLRRFDDMLVHWQIKAALARNKGINSELAKGITGEELMSLIKRSDAAEKRVRKSSKQASSWWQAGLFASRLAQPRPEGYEYDGDFVDLSQPMDASVAKMTIYGTTSSANTTPVFIPALGVETRIPGIGQSNLTVGQPLRVQMTQSLQWPAVLVDVKIV